MPQFAIGTRAEPSDSGPQRREDQNRRAARVARVGSRIQTHVRTGHWAVVASLLIPALGVAAPPKPVRSKKPATKKPAPDTAAPAPAPDSPDAAHPVDPAPWIAPASAPGPASAGAGGSSPPAADSTAKPDEPAPGSAPLLAPSAAPAQGPDVDSLRQEYLGLRDELFKSRARSNAVASQLYSTRMQVKLTYTTGRFYTPAKASIRLDGASVYEDTTGAIAGDDGIRFDGYVAPGRHLVTFRVEATGKDDDSFTSTTESQIVVKAVAGKDLLVAARARDSGDIAYEWKRSEHGSYGLGIDVAIQTAKAVETAPLSTPAATGAKK
jgi:hypothetical protein